MARPPQPPGPHRLTRLVRAQRPRANARRRGFLLVTVLMLLVIAMIIAGWSIQRAGMRAGIVQQQVDGYQRHHEERSIGAIVKRWSTQRQNDALIDAARSGEPVYEASLPTGERVTLRVTSGQGRLLRVPDAAENRIQREVIEEALAMLGDDADNPELTRSVGPPRITLSSAPEEVIMAIAEGDAAVASVVLDARREENLDGSQLMARLSTAGLDPVRVQRVASMVVAEPSLWLIDAEVRIGPTMRRYELYVDKSGQLATILSDRLVEVVDPRRGLGGGEAGGPASDNRRRDDAARRRR
jgi:hypothetical protein